MAMSTTDLPKTTLITGASSGIGRATALRLARKGWRVFAAVRRDADEQSLAAEASREGGLSLETVKLDVTDGDSIARAATDVTIRLGGRGLDGLVDNAGVGHTGPVEHTSLEQWRELYEINLFGQIAVMQAFLPLVRLARGRIVNIGSVADHLAPPFVGALASSKSAFASVSAALRVELRPQGIHVSIVEPGAIDTPAVDKTLGRVEATIAALPPEGARLYGDAMRRMTSAFMKKERSGSSPEEVAVVIERALTDRVPKTRYLVGKDALKLSTLARLLPERLLDVAILRAFGVPSGFGTAT